MRLNFYDFFFFYSFYCHSAASCALKDRLKERAEQLSISVLFGQVHKSHCVTKRGHLVKGTPQKMIQSEKEMDSTLK